VRTGENRAESLYHTAEEILKRALEVRDLNTALKAVKTAVDVMGEARQYIELRGSLASDAPTNPYGPSGKIMVLAMPKLPRAEREALSATHPGRMPPSPMSDAKPTDFSPRRSLRIII